MAYRHFVVNPIDPSFDWKKICNDLFDPDEKQLVVLEYGKKDHVHIQGMLKVSNKEFEKYRKDLASRHYRRKVDRKCLPVTKRTRDADEKGYQYMLKEGIDKVLHSVNFDKEELEVLHELSEAARTDHAESFYDVMKEHFFQLPDLGPEGIRNELLVRACEFYYDDQDSMPPPQVKRMVLKVMWKNSTCDAMKRYVALQQ